MMAANKSTTGPCRSPGNPSTPVSIFSTFFLAPPNRGVYGARVDKVGLSVRTYRSTGKPRLKLRFFHHYFSHTPGVGLGRGVWG